MGIGHSIRSWFNAVAKLQKSRAIIIPIMLMIILFTMAVKIHFHCEVCRVEADPPQAEGGRYALAAHNLYEAWTLPERIITGDLIGYLRYVTLYLPFAPHGEKSVFVFAGAVMKAVLSLIAPNSPEKFFLWLNLISLTAVVMAMSFIVSKQSPLLGLALGILMLNVSDVWILTITGYHTIFGMALFFLGVIVTGNYSHVARSLAGGMLMAFAVLASPHVAVPLLAVGFTSLLFRILQGGLRRNVFLNFFAAGAGAISIVILSFATYLLQVFTGLPSRFPISMMLWEMNQAQLYAGRLPTDFLFFFRYAHFELGGLTLGILSVGWCLSLCFPGKTFASRVMPVTTVLSILLTSLFGLPTIGRAQIPNLFLLFISAGFGFAAFSGFSVFRVRTQLATALVAAFLLFDSLYRLSIDLQQSEARVDIERMASQRAETALVNYFKEPVVSNIIVSDDDLLDLAPLIEQKIVRVDMRARALHSSYGNCGFEMLLAELLDKGLEVLAVAPATLDQQTCFLNEFHYLGFCRDNWQAAFPHREKLQSSFTPGWFYYLRGNDILRVKEEVTNGDLAAYRCNPRPGYGGPSVKSLIIPK